MSKQGRYWILTIPHHLYTPYPNVAIQYTAGQLERGGESGYLHWQLIVYFRDRVRLGRLQQLFGDGIHAELTRSDAAEEYVHKSATSVPNTQFTFGSKSTKRNSSLDWDAVWDSAKTGALASIPADIRVRSYNALKRIEKDHLRPVATEREVYVFWGPTGTGKSRRAWDEATFDAYPKVTYIYY